MLTKEEGLRVTPPFCFSVPLSPRADLGYNPIQVYKTELKEELLPMEERKTPEWEFHECCEELITFTEVSQKRFPLSGRHTNGFVFL